METNKQLSSGIDPVWDEELFDRLCDNFWQEAKKCPAEEWQLMFRLMWLGEWLGKRDNWKQQFYSCSQMDALHYAVIRRHRWLPAQVAGLSLKEMSLALTEEWTVFAAQKGLKRRIENKLDWLDGASTFKAA
ncbi:TPA: hypothetical protein ACT2TS_004916 [Citrobacter braakii]